MTLFVVTLVIPGRRVIETVARASGVERSMIVGIMDSIGEVVSLDSLTVPNLLVDKGSDSQDVD